MTRWPEWLFLAACARLSPEQSPGPRQRRHTQEHNRLASRPEEAFRQTFLEYYDLAQGLLDRCPNDWGLKQLQTDRNPAPFAPHGTSLPRAAFFSVAKPLCFGYHAEKILFNSLPPF
jgi:hypothetical protein